MNPKERKILEAELQKVYTKQTHSFRDAGKAVWNTKGIRELLDGDASLEEIQKFFREKDLSPDTYNRNAIPLGAYTYWYARGCGREDVCEWALESATTMDGFLQVQEPAHLAKLAEKFFAMDRKDDFSTRRIYLGTEVCWTDAPNTLVAILSGNIALLQAFEKERQMEEEDEEDLGWKEEFAPCRSRKLPCYTIGRENVSKKFCIPNVFTALILSGDMGMLEYGFDHYKLENPVVCRGEIEALGEAIAGAGEIMSMHILCWHEDLLQYVEIEQAIHAGNDVILDYLAGKDNILEDDISKFFGTRNIRLPFAPAPGSPREAKTDAKLYECIYYYGCVKEETEKFQKRAYAQIKKDLLEPDVSYGLDDIQENPEEKSFFWNNMFRPTVPCDWEKTPDVRDRKLELYEFYKEIGGEVTNEIQELMHAIEEEKRGEALLYGDETKRTGN